MAGKADIKDPAAAAAAAADSQPTPMNENAITAITGPGPPKMTAVATVDEANKANADDNLKGRKASQRTFICPQAAQKSPLVTMPPEIRNMIYKLCLTHPENIGDKLKLKKTVECFTVAAPYIPFQGIARPKIEEAYDFSLSKATKKSIRKHSLRNLALMGTCQAMYNDATLVFWGQPFTFKGIVQLQDFLLTPNLRLDLVRDVKVLNMSTKNGVDHMPAVSALMADKLKGLEVFEIDMGHMRYGWGIPGPQLSSPFNEDEHIRGAGQNLGFGIYSCMHPWVTEVVRKQGIDKLMAILQIVREGDPPGGLGSPRVFTHFRGHGELTEAQRKIADAATAEEIVRQIGLYD